MCSRSMRSRRSSARGCVLGATAAAQARNTTRRGALGPGTPEQRASASNWASRGFTALAAARVVCRWLGRRTAWCGRRWTARRARWWLSRRFSTRSRTPPTRRCGGQVRRVAPARPASTTAAVGGTHSCVAGGAPAEDVPRGHVPAGPQPARQHHQVRGGPSREMRRHAARSAPRNVPVRGCTCAAQAVQRAQGRERPRPLPHL